jgi:hypothetical protein
LKRDARAICSHPIANGQRSCATAPKGRTHDCKRPVFLTKITFAGWGPSTHEAALPQRRRHASQI